MCVSRVSDRRSPVPWFTTRFPDTDPSPRRGPCKRLDLRSYASEPVVSLTVPVSVIRTSANVPRDSSHPETRPTDPFLQTTV